MTKQLTKPTFMILKNCGCFGTGEVKSNKNNRDMKNVNDEQEPLINAALTFQEPDQTDVFQTNENDEQEVSDEDQEPLLYNEALFTREYADENDEQPMSQNGNELK